MAMTITPLPTPPSRTDPATFPDRGDSFLGLLPTFATEANALAADVEADALAAENAATRAEAAAGTTLVAGDVIGTSATSLAIGTGSKVFTTQSGKAWVAGMLVRAYNAGGTMTGTVTSYTGTTLTLDVTTTTGSGTFASWNLFPTEAAVSTSALGFDYIINGRMEVNQRGTSFPALSSTWVSDRWNAGAVLNSIGGKADGSIDTSVVPAGSIAAFKYTVTEAKSTLAVGDGCGILTRLEGSRVANLMMGTASAKTVKIRFKVRSSKAGVYAVVLRNQPATLSYAAEYTINAANTWESKEVTVPLSQSGSWNTGNGQIGMLILFSLAFPSQLQITAGSWQSVVAQGSTNQVNLHDTLGATFYLTDVSMVEADYSGPIPRPFDKELLLCQRFYEKSFAVTTAPAQNVGQYSGEMAFPATKAGATVNIFRQDYAVRKSIAATITFFNPAAANAQARDYTAGVDCSSTSVAGQNERGFVIQTTGAAGSAVGNHIGVHWTAAADL